jgi:putative SOS response-associated peptidase YedK
LSFELSLSNAIALDMLITQNSKLTTQNFMCGRYTLKTDGAALAQQFALPEVPQIDARYNIAPTQAVAVVRETEAGRDFEMMGWGLIPSWSKDPSIGNKMFNARSETAAEKPSFRSAMRQRRCIIPADGFYEWQATGPKTKQPIYFTMADQSLFGFAGLWEEWHSPDGSPLHTCTILTTSANELIAPVHDRMPVILAPEHYSRWLDRGMRHAEPLLDLLVPFPTDQMSARPVSSLVSRVGNEGPDLIA